jgi:hypothetical protein
MIGHLLSCATSCQLVHTALPEMIDQSNPTRDHAHLTVLQSDVWLNVPFLPFKTRL